MRLSACLHRSAVLLCLLSVGSALKSASAQETEVQTKAKVEEAAPAKSAQRAYRGRLPNNWSKLDLSEEQKDRIYKAQLASRDKLESLESKLEEIRKQSALVREEIQKLRSQLDKELQAILLPAQVEKLKQVEKEAEQRRVERRSERAKAAESKKESPSN
jgi:archaellum component FlaC